MLHFFLLMWLRDAVKPKCVACDGLRDCEMLFVSPTHKNDIARQRVLGSSFVRASKHGGLWVRIPSGAQIFSVSSYGWFFISPFII